jgi:hypothetical protein
MNFERIDRGRTLDPEEISTRRNCHAITRREVSVHGFQYHRLLIRQDATKPQEVRIIAAEPQHLRDTQLNG